MHTGLNGWEYVQADGTCFSLLGPSSFFAEFSSFSLELLNGWDFVLGRWGAVSLCWALCLFFRCC